MFVVILIILLSVYLFLLFQKKKDNFLVFKPLNNNTELKIINSKFINSHLNVTIKEIGNDKKILIIENFFKDPKYHLEYIKNNKNKEVSQHKSNGYPGVRIGGNEQLINEVIGFLSFAGIIYYNKDTSKYSVINCDNGYSIINFPNNKLSHNNIYPHVDCSYKEDNKIKRSGLACVVYLCNTTKEYNGTGFYTLKYPIRQKKFKTDEKYKEAREIMKKYEDNPKYCIDKEERIFKKLYEVDAKMNRIVIYPTYYRHQGIINSDYYHDKNNIRKDRYTYTGFTFFENIKVDQNDIEEPD